LSRPSLLLLIILIAGAVAPAAAPAQDQGLPPEDPRNRPVEPPKVTNRIHVKIEQHIDEPNILQHKSLYPPLRFEENGNLIVIDAETWYGMPNKDPETPVNFGLGVRVSLLTFSVGGGGGLNTPDIIIGSQPQPPPPQFPDPNPNPPPISKPSGFGSVSGGSGDSDTAPFSGPELTYAVKRDLTEWRATRWLPEESSFEIYARAQFGQLHFSSVSTTATLYGAGLRLNLPFILQEKFHLDASICAGPAYLTTSLGNATAIDAALGIRAVQVLSPGLNLVASIQYEGLAAKGASTFGPSFNLGLDLSW
jgi:hypothetical protein